MTFYSLSKNFNTEYPHKDNNFKDNIISYDCKPFPGYSKKNSYITKIKLKKQKTSSLIKNKKIFNFFTSKDFYNLKIENKNNIDNNNLMKSSQNRSITKHLEKLFLNRKKNKSTNKNYEKSNIYKDLNIVDSHSFLLKTFNKDNNCKNTDITNNKKTNECKFNLNYFNVNKFKKII